jgi:uncharacterized membrane protein
MESEALAILFGFIVVGFIILAPIIALVRVGRLKRSAATQAELGSLTQRLYALERKLEALQAPPQPAAVATPAARPAAATPVKPIPAPPAPAAPPITPIISPTIPAAPPAASPPLVPPREPAPAAPPKAAAPTTVLPPLTRPPAAPSVPTFARKASPAEEKRNMASLEERLGTNWLSKIGITLMVLGVAYLLNYTLTHIGPAGKIATGYAVGAILIALGILGERKERYRIAARAVLGGGWAIVYFTTYAMHNVAAVRVIESPEAGFALLFLVAAAMVVHTLRYNSQVATGFAYLLAFASIGVSQIGLEGLIGSAVLAASLAYLLWRRKWYALELPAIVATYALHWLWLDQLYDRMGAHEPFPQLNASAALLTGYWAIWMISYFLREENGDEQRALLTSSFFLNVGGFLVVIRYQAFFPQLRFWFLLAVGLAYLALSPLAKKLRRRTAFVLTSTIGAALIATAIPYRYSGARLELLWLVEAEAFLIAGWRLAEVHLRRIGWAASGLLTIYLCAFPLSERLTNWRAPEASFGWQLGAIAVAFFLNARFALPLLGKQANRLDEGAVQVSHGVATVLLLAAAWVTLPLMWVAMVWTAIAVGLGEWGRRAKSTELALCGHGAAVLALGRLLTINLQRSEDFHGVSLRLITVAVSAILLFIEARRLRVFLPGDAGPLAETEIRFGGIPAAYSWSGTVLAAALIWQEAPSMIIGLAWGILAVALIEAGCALKEQSLRAQGHVLAMMCVARLVIFDLQQTGEFHGVSQRLLTLGITAALFYVESRRLGAFAPAPTGAGAQANPAEALGGLPGIYAVAGTLLTALIIWQEATNMAVGLAWGLLGLALLEIGRLAKDRPLRMQGHIMLTLSMVRIFIADLNGTAMVGPVSARVVTVTLLVAMYYYVAFTTPSESETDRQAWVPEIRPLFLWYAAAAMVALLRFELEPSWVAVGWAALVVIFYRLGSMLSTPSLRYQAYFLTLLAGVRCALDNFYQLGPWPFTNIRVVTVGTVSLLFYLLLLRVVWERRGRAAPEKETSRG